MNTYGGVEVLLDPLIKLVLDGGEWSDLRSGRFSSRQKYRIGSWVGLRAGMEGSSGDKSLTKPGIESRLLCYAASSLVTKLTELFRLPEHITKVIT
jgi:hypothetical protein